MAPDSTPVTRIIDLIVQEASNRAAPTRSAGAFIRHGLSQLPEPARRQIASAVEGQLAQRVRAHELAPATRWLTLREAADLLGIAPCVLREQLRWPQFRRRYGWPQWGGQDPDDWSFRSAVLDPGAFVVVPADEPYGVLPPHHLRADQVDMESAPPLRLTPA